MSCNITCLMLFLCCMIKRRKLADQDNYVKGLAPTQKSVGQRLPSGKKGEEINIKKIFFGSDHFIKKSFTVLVNSIPLIKIVR